MSYKHRYRALIRLATQRSTLPARLQASETPAKIELLHEAALLVLRRQRSRPFIIILKHYSAPHVKANSVVLLPYRYKRLLSKRHSFSNNRC